jgi:predicted permease
VQQPEQLVLLGDGHASGTNDDFAHNEPDLFSWPFFKEIRKDNSVFSDILAIRSFGTSAHVRYPDAADLEPVHIRFVSGNYFSVLGVPASVGRVLIPEDDRVQGAAPVVVLRYGYWERRFARDKGVIGRTAQINGLPVTIVGVAAPEFFGVVVGSLPDFWIPLTAQAHGQPLPNEAFGPLTQSLWLIGRLKPGISPARAQAGVNITFRQWLHAVAGPSPSIEQIQKMERAHVTLADASRGLSRLRQEFSGPLQIVMALVGLVLLIACANIANLLLARSSSRQKEMGLRIALGASPRRLFAQLLCENLLLALGGGCLGLLLSLAGVRLLLAIVSSGGSAVPLVVGLDVRVLLYCSGLSVLTGLIFGIAPALYLVGVDVGPALKGGRGLSRSQSHTLLGQTLVVMQVGLAFLLLLGAALFVGTFRNLEQAGIGFDTARIHVLRIDSDSIGGSSPAFLLNLYRRVETRVQELPGVDAASFSELAFNEGHWRALAWPGGIQRNEANGIQFNGNHVGLQYFRALGTPIILGRGFGVHDTLKTRPAAVVNETFARTLFPHTSPLGRRFSLSEQVDDGIEIVGVVKDARYESVREGPIGAFFLYNGQKAAPDGYSDLIIRTRLAAQQIVPEVRAALRTENPDLAISSQRTLTEQIDDSLGKEKLLADLAGFFGVAALLLACIGLYGIVAYSVARRRNEIGIRMALGARPVDILGGVLRQTFNLVFAGMALGLPLALLGGHFVSSQLYGVQPAEPVYITMSAVALMGTALVAGLIPGRRAVLLDPLTALRQD